MKKLVNNMLIIIMSFLVLNGCAAKVCPEPKIEVVYVNRYIECPAPPTPTYGLLNPELHMGHLGNLEMMRTDLELAMRYNDSLENTILCYTRQTVEPEDKNKSNMTLMGQ